MATALPGGAACLGQPFHFQLCGSGGNSTWLSFGGGLTRSHVLAHLRGEIVIAPRWPQKVDCFEVDIDAKDAAGRRSLFYRLELVIAALDHRHEDLPRGCACCVGGRHIAGGTMMKYAFSQTDVVPAQQPLGVVWRSSRGRFGGLRYRVFLDQLHDARNVQLRVEDALRSFDLNPRNGVEVFPRGTGSCRAPLGKGSELLNSYGGRLDVETCADLYGVRFKRAVDDAWLAVGERERGGRVIRSVSELVAAWSAFARNRVSLVTVVGRERARSGWCPPKTLRNSTATVAAPTSYGVAASLGRRAPGNWLSEIEDIETNGAPAGGRVRALGNLVFDSVVCRGLDEGSAMNRVERWLSRAPHSSKDLTGSNADAVREQMSQSAMREIAKLTARIEAGELTRGCVRDASRPCLLWPRSWIDRHARAWRTELAKTLSPIEQSAIEAATSSVRMARALILLKALVVLAMTENPASSTVAILKDGLQTLIGGRRLKSDSATSDDPSSPYRQLVAEAQRIGVLGPLLQRGSKATRRASIYAVPPGTKQQASVRRELVSTVPSFFLKE